MTQQFQLELKQHRRSLPANTLHIFDAGTNLKGWQLNVILRLFKIDLSNPNLKFATVLDLLVNWEQDAANEKVSGLDLLRAPWRWCIAIFDAALLILIIGPLFFKQMRLWHTPFEKLLGAFILGALAAPDAPTNKQKI